MSFDETRQAEINSFAAMAIADPSGTFELGSSSGGGNNDKEPESSVEPQNNQKRDGTDNSRNMFAQAALQVENSGTFSLQEPTNANAASNHYLEAAAAALGADDDFDATRYKRDDASSSSITLPGTNSNSTTPKQSQIPWRPKLQAKTPMHTQQVYMPRPLFFGPHLPPRVIEESRIIVENAFNSNSANNNNKDQLPPEVRNLISTVHMYGNGISVLPGEESKTATSYVSVFCPKWSAEETKSWENDTTQNNNFDDSFFSVTSSPEQPNSNHPEAPTAESTIEHPEPTTAAGQSTAGETISTTTTTTVETNSISERDMFSILARGETPDVDTSLENSPNRKVPLVNSSNSLDLNANNSTNDLLEQQQQLLLQSDAGIMSDQDVFLQWARGESPIPIRSRTNTGGSNEPIRSRTNTGSSIEEGPVPMSDQGLFTQWVRGGSPANVSAERSTATTGASFGNSTVFSNSDSSMQGTFFVKSNSDNGGNDSDDDSVVGSELKKKVGVNEHLNAALASLEEGDWRLPKEKDVEPEPPSTQRVPLTRDGGRPMTNHELMNGNAPLFGVDDSPLPGEADLGIHDTREEQQRSREQRQNQIIIETCCPQNVFGPMACPNPALHPEDNHSWNSRSIHSSRGGIPATVSSASRLVGLNSPNGRSSSPSSKASQKPLGHPQHRTLDPRSRFGWWNLAEQDILENSLAVNSSADSAEMEDEAQEEPLQLPPWEHPASTVLVQTRLEPTPEKLHEQNRPLSQLHPATSLAQSLPFLSDRPPSYRYLQIDTQAVGFPALGGDIEPLFCSLAIYHVDTVSQNSSSTSDVTPIPELQRCGKVTETLHFDVVSDPKLVQSCAGSLWPYNRKATDAGSEQTLQGTRCGVFPLPSNLSIHNLYAILIVHKVVSEGSDFEAYLRSGQTVDLEVLRNRAERAAEQQGTFLMPFAFGVAPLLQVFGADIPLVPSSRAVQIPLFRFSSGHGERQIIDHIMVMLYPR